MYRLTHFPLQCFQSMYSNITAFWLLHFPCSTQVIFFSNQKKLQKCKFIWIWSKRGLSHLLFVQVVINGCPQVSVNMYSCRTSECVKAKYCRISNINCKMTSDQILSFLYQPEDSHIYNDSDTASSVSCTTFKCFYVIMCSPPFCFSWFIRFYFKQNHFCLIYFKGSTFSLAEVLYAIIGGCAPFSWSWQCQFTFQSKHFLQFWNKAAIQCNP